MASLVQTNDLAKRKRKRKTLSEVRQHQAWKLLLPALIVLLMVAALPLLKTIWFSFTDANINNLDEYNFIGFGNYLSFEDGEWYGILADPIWWRSVWNTVTFTTISVSLETIFGIGVALILNKEFRGRGIVRAAVLIPWCIPTIVSAQIFAWMLHSEFGVINDMLMTLGMIEKPLAWTADSDLSLPTIILVDTWKTIPFMALLCLAALQMVPKNVYKAAKVDGVSPVRVFFYITLPMIAPAVAVAVVFRALDALRVFDLIYVLTSNNSNTISMSVYARQQLVDYQDVGAGSAASTLLFIIIALITLVYLYAQRKQFEE